jgi:hypothetical protein
MDIARSYRSGREEGATLSLRSRHGAGADGRWLV